MGPDDVAFWGWANVVKGKARDQRQGVAGRRVQDFHSGSWNDFGGFHKILKSAIDCLESDGIAPPNVAKRTEKSVAVAGRTTLPSVPGRAVSGTWPTARRRIVCESP